MRMIVRIDEPGHDQPSGCIDHFVHGIGCKIGTNRNYLVVFDQGIGDRRLMDIAVVVIYLTASDQRSFRGHLCSILCTPYAAAEFAFRGIDQSLTRRSASATRGAFPTFSALMHRGSALV